MEQPKQANEKQTQSKGSISPSLLELLATVRVCEDQTQQFLVQQIMLT